MAASVKIEFDDGSRVISQTLEEATGVTAARGSKALSWDHRHPSCSMDDFYEIPRTTKFIANGNFQRVALQFPDPLLREAPEVVWTLQARVRKLKAAARRAEGEETEPLIFVTGDTSYGSCCVDEVSAQHLKADAIIHYGRACLSPTNSSVPVLYVFGRGKIRVEDLADTLLSGPLSPTAPTLNSSGAAGDEAKPPVLLLYDVTYAHAIPDLLKALGEEATRDGKLVVGFPTPEAYSPLGTEAPGSGSGSRRQAGCGSGAATSSAPQGDLPNCRSEGQRTACFGADAAGDRSSCSRGSAGAGGEDGSCRRSDSETPAMAGDARPGSPPTAEEQACPPRAEIPAVAASGRREEGTEQSSALLQAARQGGNASKAAAEGEVSAFGPPMASSAEASRRRVRIGGLGVELDSEESLKRHALFFVGGEGRQLSNVLLRCAGCVDRMRYDPSLPEGERLIADTGRGNKDLNRRYYLVQRAKEAGVVGIVVGTLGVQRYSSVVRSLRKMIEDAGRKAYTLAVGKVNVAKLANFAEVDVFCLVACAENSLLDSREFHAPVVTPLELEVALGKREWDGFYSTDFDDLRAFQGAQQGRHPLPPPPSTGANDPGSPGQPSSTKDPVTSGSAIESLALGGEDPKSRDRGYDSDGDRPFFSLITGGFKSIPGMARAASTPAAACLAGSEGSGALVGIGDRSLVEWSSPAADFLGQREFQGLEALKGQTEAKPATEGQSGIASDYGGV